MRALAPCSQSKVQALVGSAHTSLCQHKLVPVAKNKRKKKEPPAPSKLSASTPPPLSEDGNLQFTLHSEGRAVAPCQAQSAGGNNSDNLESVKKKRRNLRPLSPFTFSLLSDEGASKTLPSLLSALQHTSLPAA